VSHLVLPGGKYAVYIWPAYAVSILGFAGMILDTLIKSSRWRRRTRELEQDRERERDR
jgi:heme exporter protein D